MTKKKTKWREEMKNKQHTRALWTIDEATLQYSRLLWNWVQHFVLRGMRRWMDDSQFFFLHSHSILAGFILVSIWHSELGFNSIQTTIDIYSWGGRPSQSVKTEKKRLFGHILFDARWLLL